MQIQSQMSQMRDDKGRYGQQNMTELLMSYDKNEAVCCIDQSLGSGCLLFVYIVVCHKSYSLNA
jgi:hypothetical protein